MLVYDPSSFYSKIENHDITFSVASAMVSYYNTIISLPWNEEWQIKLYEEERNQFKFYDV